MRLGREGVLLLPCDAVFLGDHLPCHAHVKVVVDIPQPVVDHRVHQRAIAHPIAGSRLGQQVRRVGHGFHAPGDNKFRIPGLNGLGRQSHRLKSRAADFVDGERADHGGRPP